MEDSPIVQPVDDTGEFALGIMLGTRRAFAAVAGRCSAADAECLRQIRDRKLYLRRATSWDEFCPSHLGLSRAHANRIIRCLEEFGPDYFEVAQLTRITPEQYRAIAPAIREQNIHVNGQAIALIPENSEQVAAAVAELRQAVTPAVEVPVPDRMASLTRRFDQLVADFQELAQSGVSLAEKSQMGGMLTAIMIKLETLHRQMRC